MTLTAATTTPSPPLSTKHAATKPKTQISKIQGLHNCTKLERLHLYSNRIERIENLDSLTSLQVLWLSDNKITQVENLGALTNLREINLARNSITRVGEVLLAGPSPPPPNPHSPSSQHLLSRA
jgi:Leucine-rich repeat (LRR) protein